MASARVREYTTLVNRLKHLEKINRGDSEDADHIRELMEDCWRSFTAEEANEVEALSSPKLLEEG